MAVNRPGPGGGPRLSTGCQFYCRSCLVTLNNTTVNCCLLVDMFAAGDWDLLISGKRTRISLSPFRSTDYGRPAAEDTTQRNTGLVSVYLSGVPPIGSTTWWRQRDNSRAEPAPACFT